MHNAPSVSYPVGRSLVAGAFAAAACLLGAWATVQWARQSQVDGGLLVLAVVVLAAVALLSGRQWWVMPQGELAWDGQSWIWSTAGSVGCGGVTVSLDLQWCMLLHWRGSGGAHWIWLERSHAPERWDALRRAVYSRARSRALPKPGAAEP
jgi:hypothetical protein